jgi:hypothetical protein
MLYRSVDAFGNPLTDTQTAPGLIDKKYKKPTLSTVRTADDMVPSERGANVKSGETERLIRSFEGRLAALHKQNEEILDKLQSISGLLDKFGQSKDSPAEVQSSPIGLDLDSLDSKPWVALGISKSGYYAKKKSGEIG